MKMFLTWFRIFLMRELRQPVFYIQLLVMILAISIVNGVEIPPQDAISVGILYTGQAGDKIYQNIAQENQSVNLKEYHDEDDMKASVRTGAIDCGFVLPENFGENEKIKYYTSPFTRAGEQEKEAIFAAAYQTISEELLLEADEEIYGDEDEERQKYLLDKNNELLTEEQVLTIDWQSVDGKEPDTKQMIKPYFTQITAAVFALLMIVVGGICFRDKACTGSILYSVPRRQRRLMCFANDLAVGIIPAAIVVWCVFFLK